MAGYVVKYGSEIVYQAGDDQHMIHDATLGMRTDGVGTFTFTMVPNHPLRREVKLRDLENAIEVSFDGEVLFSGFIDSMAETFNLELAVSCVSDLQLLKDIHMRIEDHPKNNGNRRVYTARSLFKAAIDKYNKIVVAMLEGARTFTIGHNIADDAAGYVDPTNGQVVVDAAASTPTPILDVLTRSIIDPYGCMLKTWRNSSGKRYIGLYTSAPDTNDQTIRFGENMTKYTKVMSTENMYNGCLPVGGSRRDYDVTFARWVRTDRVCEENTDFFWVYSIDGKTDDFEGNPITVAKGDLLKLGDGEYQFAKDVVIPAGSANAVQVFIEGEHQDEVHANCDGFWFDRKTKYATRPLTLGRMADGFYNIQGQILPEDNPNALYRKIDEVLYYRKSSQVAHDGVLGYGLKTFTFTDSDVLTEQGLFRRAISMLMPKVHPTITLEVSGVDMALYMSGYQHLVAGQKVRVVSEPHDVDLTMQVTQATLSLDNPAATKYVIGPVPTTATKRIVQLGQDSNDVRDIITYDMNDVITGDEILRLQ